MKMKNTLNLINDYMEMVNRWIIDDTNSNVEKVAYKQMKEILKNIKERFEIDVKEN